jgi:uncharacterized phage protein gp47/JayE
MGFMRKTFSEITESMILWVRGNTAKLTNFDIGSKTRTVLEAVAITIEELYSYTYDTLKSLMEESIYMVFNFQRLPAKKAIGTVTFKRNSAASVNYTIPVGTMVATAATELKPAVRFLTTKTVILTIGLTEVSAPVEAEIEGTIGNVNAGTVTEFVTKPVGVDSVTNALGFVTGRDIETRDARKIRFRNFFVSRFKATREALEYGAKEVDGVKLAKVVESPYVYAIIDSGVEKIDISPYANDPFETDANLLPAVESPGNAVYIGAIDKFDFIYFKFSVSGVGSGGVWEYFDGSSWLEIPGATDGTIGLTENGTLKFVRPVDWKDTKIEDIWAFWIRFRIITAAYTVTPRIGHIFVSPPPGRVELYIDDGNGYANSELLSAVAAHIENYRGAGISINVKAPAIITLSIGCEVKISDRYTKADIKAKVETIITDFGKELGLGDDLILTKLINRIISIENGNAVESVKMTSPESDVLVSGSDVIKFESPVQVVVLN